MSCLNSYLMIPFLAFFGCQDWVVRLPQLIVSCFTLYVFYRLIRTVFGARAGLIGLLFLSICPWHFMISRWGLDCNLAPGFLLFGFFFFIRGIEHSKYLILSALFYGLCLYCYAMVWPVMPLMLILQTGYLFYVRNIRLDRYVGIAVGLLGLLALPLIVFLLVNVGFMEEIRTPIFSIPRLTAMRGNEISFKNISDNLKNFLTVLYKQNDGLYVNAPNDFGIYYRWTPVFAMLGIFYSILRLWKSLKERIFDMPVLLLIPFFCEILLGCIVKINISRINCIHLFIIAFIVMGMELVIRGFGKYSNYIWVLSMCMLLVCFNDYRKFYFRTYGPNLGVIFKSGVEDSVNYALEMAEDKEIYVETSFAYSQVLFYAQFPVTEYRDTVVYTNYPSEFLDVDSFGPFHMGFEDAVQGNIYIIYEDSIQRFLENGWNIERFGYTAVAY